MAVPRQVESTVRTVLGNAWGLTVGGGVEPPLPTPSAVISDGPHRTLRRYRTSGTTTGNPVLLVPPLAVSIECYDLRPGQSLAAYLCDRGRATYVVDYGDITFADRGMGFEDWVEGILPDAIQRVSAEHDGAPVDVIGWSLGGTMLYLTAANDPSLPIGALVALGTPVDYGRIAGPALARAIGRYTGGRLLAAPAAILGGIPRHAVRIGYRLTAPQRELTKPWYAVRNLHDTEALARMQAIDRFQAAMPGYPGRLYLQMYQRLILRLELKKGSVRLSDSLVVELAKLSARVLVIGSPTDAIAPAPAVRAALDVLTGAESIRYEEVEASHLGLVAAVDAHRKSWPLIADFLDAS